MGQPWPRSRSRNVVSIFLQPPTCNNLWDNDAFPEEYDISSSDLSIDKNVKKLCKYFSDDAWRASQRSFPFMLRFPGAKIEEVESPPPLLPAHHHHKSCGWVSSAPSVHVLSSCDKSFLFSRLRGSLMKDTVSGGAIVHLTTGSCQAARYVCSRWRFKAGGVLTCFNVLLLAAITVLGATGVLAHARETSVSDILAGEMHLVRAGNIWKDSRTTIVKYAMPSKIETNATDGNPIVVSNRFKSLVVT